MKNLYGSIQLENSELEMVQDLLRNSSWQLKRHLAEVEECKASIAEFGDFDFDSEVDAEYYIELMEAMGKKIEAVQSEIPRNQVTYIEQAEMFRVEQMVFVYQVSGRVIDQLVYVFRCRHGLHYVYFCLESLVASFTKGKESAHHFGCEKEVEHFLRYWQG